MSSARSIAALRSPPGTRYRCANTSRFCSTVSDTSRLSSCGTTPISARACLESSGSVKPSTSSSPSSAITCAVRAFIVVDLPAPLGPSRPTHIPNGTSRSRPSTAVIGPNRLTNPRSLIADSTVLTFARARTLLVSSGAPAPSGRRLQGRKTLHDKPQGGTADLLDLADRLWEGREPIENHHPVGFTGGLAVLEDGLAFLPSFANVTAFETGDGLVLVDTGGFLLAEQVHAQLREWTDQPLHTAIYSHGHVDHVFGVAPFEAEGSTPAGGGPRERAAAVRPLRAHRRATTAPSTRASSACPS